jgi:hypothetical protein
MKASKSKSDTALFRNYSLYKSRLICLLRRVVLFVLNMKFSFITALSWYFLANILNVTQFWISQKKIMLEMAYSVPYQIDG